MTTKTPMMLQWEQCKQRAKEGILLFRLGDFYEAFYEDASLLAKELNLTLTQRQGIPMSGIPAHASESYIEKLVQKGHLIAIAEQVEDPKHVKGIVKREIVRTISPGTILQSNQLQEKQHNFIVSITKLNSIYALAFLDLSIGEFSVVEFEHKKQLIDELYKEKPSEILISKKCYAHLENLLQELQQIITFRLVIRDEWYFDHKMATETLLQHFRLHTLDGFGLQGMVAAINAAGALFTYIQDDLHLPTEHIRSIKKETAANYMALDRSTQANLELFHSQRDYNTKTSLLHLLDQTHTPMGGRQLRFWLSHPLLCKEDIQKRQEGTQEFLSSSQIWGQLRDSLSKIRDLQRLMIRITTGYASPRDLVALRFSLEQAAPISDLLSSFSSSLLQEMLEKFSDLSPLTHHIQFAIVDEPPIRLSDGGIFRKGYHQKLDELHLLKSNSKQFLANYQQELRDALDIKTLKISFNKAFGYYIDVSRAQAHKMPPTFQKRQTLVNNERFISPELKTYEEKIFGAEDEIAKIEQNLFTEIRKKVQEYQQPIKELSEALGVIDSLFALALVAKKQNYCCPKVDNEEHILIEKGRHPIIEASIRDQTFIENDTTLDKKERLLLLTGPNMSGKSTYIRQVALIVIMAQIGSFVPATSAQIGIVDKVFSRIGASDDLARGQSTFMVEMTETANILHNATAKSLVILDEIGRGTSTYDGISIAWAVAEYLLEKWAKPIKTLFATHYFELTELEKKNPHVVNYNVAVHEGDNGIVFLHKILRGSADKSYGIHVAKLAGIPSITLRKAAEMLNKLEKKKPASSRAKSKQLTLFEKEDKDELKEEIKQLDLHTLTPLDALMQIKQWQDQIKSGF